MKFKVILRQGYNTIEFVFENFLDASMFIEIAMLNSYNEEVKAQIERVKTNEEEE